MLCEMVNFQDKKKRVGYGQKLKNGPDRSLCNQTKEIQKDFPKFAVFFEPKI